MSERASAVREAVAAIREVEARLLDALCGQGVRGLVDVAPPFGVRAANVRARGSHGIDTFLGERPTLVIGITGRLAIARVGPFEFLPALDSDLLVEDQVDVARAVAEVLDRHAARCERTTRTYERSADLSRRLREVLGR